MIAFDRPPELGTIVKLDNQPFECVAEEPYTRRDGRASVLLIWESPCPSCGETFRQSTARLFRSLARRCDGCKRSGKPVKGKRGRRVEVSIIEP